VAYTDTDDELDDERKRDDEEEPSPPPVRLPSRASVASPLDTNKPMPSVASPLDTMEPTMAPNGDKLTAPPATQPVSVKSPLDVPHPDPYGEYNSRIASPHGVDNKDWGKQHPFLHALAKIGDVAGTALAPGLTMAIPGTMLNERIQEHHLLNRGKALESENEQALKDTGTEATTEHTQAETEALKNPQPKPKEEEWSIVPNSKGPGGRPLQQEKNSGQLREVPEGFGVNEKPNNENLQQGYAGAIGEALKAGRDPATDPHVQAWKSAIDDSQKAQKDNKAVSGTMNGSPAWGLQTENGWVDPDTKKPLPGFKPPQVAQFGQQENMFNQRQEAPTTQERNAAARASIIVKHIPNVIKEINDMGDELGPVTGRWDAFMQGKVGMKNPRFAGLRSDLVMVATGVALAHAVGRLPENLRIEFDQMINAPQQNAKNIVSVLNHIKPFLEDTAQLGGPREKSAAGAGGGNQPPAGAKVRTFNPNTGKLE
jgi:hypothetical protein